MRVFKTKSFSRWARKESVSDLVLRNVVKEMESGLVDAVLGGNIYKKRVRIQGRGKSGGARTILAYKSSEKAFFVFGFMKSDRSNIGQEELTYLRHVAKDLMSADENKLEYFLVSGKMEEITDG